MGGGRRRVVEAGVSAETQFMTRRLEPLRGHSPENGAIAPATLGLLQPQPAATREVISEPALYDFQQFDSIFFSLV